jgi:DNA-binding transcriptional regulator YiaG
MDPDQIRALLARLGLTQGAAARLLGIDARTIRKWCGGERGMPEPARRLLLAIEQVPALRSWLQEIAPD